MTLCLFERPEDGEAAREIRLDPRQNRTGDIWHVFVEGLAVGALYLYRADGPFMPERGYRFNPHRALLIPTRSPDRGITWDLPESPSLRSVHSLFGFGILTENDAAFVPKCIVEGRVPTGQETGPSNIRCGLRYLRSPVLGLTVTRLRGGESGTYRGSSKSFPS
jgi:glycogen operon protein